MNIAFVASEIAPYASSGGLAEVAGALPGALERAGDHVIRIMPLYRRVLDGGFKLTDTGIRLKVSVGFRSYMADVWFSEDPGPRTYFIRRDEFFDRAQLYNLPERDYEDNFERFLFFQKAAVQFIDQYRPSIDLVHANDWQTGLIPTLMAYGADGRARARTCPTVFTIHNLAFQGVFPGSDYTLTNLPFSEFTMETSEFYGNINSLKAGIKRADAVTTVSRTYAEDIQREDSGCGLHGVLQSVRGKLTGILNGIDDTEWNPAKDSGIAATYDANEMRGKMQCRENLLRQFGLNTRFKGPLLGMVTRLTADKGFELLAEELPAVLDRHPVSLVILGQGPDRFTNLCRGWAERWSGRVGFLNAFDRPMSHRVMAGADILLMPSKVEPCGLAQLYAMRYGTIPVAHATGGIKDTVEPVRMGSSGTGFVFSPFEGVSFRTALDEAIRHFSDRALWEGIMRRAMSKDYSWSRSADAYRAIYSTLKRA